MTYCRGIVYGSAQCLYHAHIKPRPQKQRQEATFRRMKLLYSPSVRKVVGIAVLLFILELNMIALYTYTMVDHPHNNEAQSKPKDSIVRVKRIVNVVTGLLPGGETQTDNIIDSGSGDGPTLTGEKVKSHFNVTKKPRPLPPTKKAKQPKLPAKPRPKARPNYHFPQRPPPVIVIGVKCSGVSIFEQLMKLHPQIITTNQTYQKILSHNEKKERRGVRKGQIMIDISTELFMNKEAPPTLKRAVPYLKIIVIFRDPLDRCLSCYHKLYSQSEGSGQRSFDDFVLNSKGKVNTQSDLIIESTYDTHLSYWLRFFNKTQWLFLDHYQITNQPYRTLRRLETFIGLKPFYKRDHFIYNKQQSLCLIDKLNRSSIPFCLQSNGTITDVPISADTEDLLKEYFTPHMEKTLSLVSSQTYLGDLVSLIN